MGIQIRSIARYRRGIGPLPSVACALLLVWVVLPDLVHGALPKAGQAFPPLDNRVVTHPERDCTRKDPCPFQRITVREALNLNKPMFISFSDPVHCVSCRVVLKVMGELDQKYGDRIILIFINTRKDKAIIKQLKLYGHPWNVYVNRQGTVVRRFPGEITLEGASAVLDTMLAG